MKVYSIFLALLLFSSCVDCIKPHKEKMTNPCPTQFLFLKHQVRDLKKLEANETVINKCIAMCKEMDQFEFESCQVKDKRNSRNIKTKTKVQLMEVCAEFEY